MAKEPEIDVEELLSRIREDVRRRESLVASSTSEIVASPFDNGHTVADLTTLRALADVREVTYASHRAVLGPLVVAFKRALQKLLTPILERQVAYNAASLRMTEHLRESIDTLERRRARVNEQLGALETRWRQDLVALGARVREEQSRLGAETTSRIDQLRPQMDELRSATTATRDRIVQAERQLRRLLHLLEAGRPALPDRAGAHAAPAPLAAPELEAPFSYTAFEDRFRGPEAEIKQRQRVYLPYFQGRETVLDVGCGRGEFLELLRESGIKAQGIDADLDMALLCRDKMLDVVREDAFAHLGARPDGSVGGIFCAQLIEHLPPPRVIDLVRLCYRKLTPGGVLVLETPNPQCLMVFADSFYRDPSHLQPIHPDTLKYVFEATGFQEIEVQFSAPVRPELRIPALQVPGAELFNEGIARLNALLFGFQDYAVIGRKLFAD